METKDIIFAFATATDLSLYDVEVAIRERARLDCVELVDARDWLDVADSIWVAL